MKCDCPDHVTWTVFNLGAQMLESCPHSPVENVLSSVEACTSATVY